jgi:hypothetical protein
MPVARGSPTDDDQPTATRRHDGATTAAGPAADGGRSSVPPMQSDRFRAAAETKDFSAFEEIFAADVTFRSPAVFRPYEGRDAVAMLLTAVSEVFEDFHYTDQLETGETAMLAFTARVGTRALDGIDLLRFNDQRRICEMAVYIRPLSGLNALAEAMQQKLSS